MKLNSIVKVEKKEVKCFCVDILEANPEDTPCRCGARDNKLHNQGQEDYGNREVGLDVEKIKLCPENCKFIGITEEEQNKYPTKLKPYHCCNLTRDYTRLYHNKSHPRLCRSEKCLYLVLALKAKEGSIIIEIK